MTILIVDDTESIRLLFRRFLRSDGLKEVVLVESAADAFEVLDLGVSVDSDPAIDLILMDLVMPEMDGIEACRRIKADERLRDIPIIMVTAVDEVESLKEALEAGAIDYIKKPTNKVELAARVRAGLRLKEEIDRRKAREHELEEANRILQRLTYMDGLTGVFNRRYFDQSIKKEWKLAERANLTIALIMLDIDYFKRFNDAYGHQEGDVCLKKVAEALNRALRRPSDFVARYGGEEFVAVLLNTNTDGAVIVAKAMQNQVRSLAIVHDESEVSRHVSVSIGVGCMKPERYSQPAVLIAKADQALYKAKQEGRNRIKVAND